jgi:hypothetical protein
MACRLALSLLAKTWIAVFERMSACSLACANDTHHPPTAQVDFDEIRVGSKGQGRQGKNDVLAIDDPPFARFGPICCFRRDKAVEQLEYGKTGRARAGFT